MTPRVVLLRGTAANPWELRPWELLHEQGRADVRLVVAPDNLYDVASLRLPTTPVRTTGALMPPGPPGRLMLQAVGQRHIGLAAALEGADVVHAAELGYWFSRQAARLKKRGGFRLVITVWETLPFVDAYRNLRTRRYRREVLEATDLFLATTERAAQALALEGAPRDRIRVSAPGIDVDRFASESTSPSAGGKPGSPGPSGGGERASPAPSADSDPHLVLSIGRLVWEKGHQDLIRALALLERRDVRVLIVGSGPEKGRLRATARDLGVEERVELRGFVPHDEVPALLARASCLVLASLPTPYWEEQFGMVLAEAMAARVPVVAAASGAIPEVLGDYGTLFPAGDWMQLARALDDGVLSQPPGTRASADPGRVERFSVAAAADRLEAAYADLLGS